MDPLDRTGFARTSTSSSLPSNSHSALHPLVLYHLSAPLLRFFSQKFARFILKKFPFQYFLHEVPFCVSKACSLKTAVRWQTEKAFAENTVGIIQPRAASADNNYKCLPVSLSGGGGAINIYFKNQMLKFP